MMNPVLLYGLAYTSSNINESPSDGGSEVTESPRWLEAVAPSPLSDGRQLLWQLSCLGDGRQLLWVTSVVGGSRYDNWATSVMEGTTKVASWYKLLVIWEQELHFNYKSLNISVTISVTNNIIWSNLTFWLRPFFLLVYNPRHQLLHLLCWAWTQWWLAGQSELNRKRKKLLKDEKWQPADNLKKYKMERIPKNNVILKTQDTSQNKTKLEWDCIVIFWLYFQVIIRSMTDDVRWWLWNKVKILQL